MREGKVKRYHMEILGMTLPPRRERIDNIFSGSDPRENSAIFNKTDTTATATNAKNSQNRYTLDFIHDKQEIGKNIISPHMMVVGFMLFVGT
ncbi:MAG: hypothetical protein WD512_04160, partial [Candidatus Paceibacterota bacterium]